MSDEPIILESDSGYIDFEKFAADAEQKVKASRAVIAIMPNNREGDLKMAVEVGFAILFDKPLIIVVPENRTDHIRLLKIADHIVRGDTRSRDGREKISAEINKIIVRISARR